MKEWSSVTSSANDSNTTMSSSTSQGIAIAWNRMISCLDPDGRDVLKEWEEHDLTMEESYSDDDAESTLLDKEEEEEEASAEVFGCCGPIKTRNFEKGLPKESKSRWKFLHHHHYYGDDDDDNEDDGDDNDDDEKTLDSMFRASDTEQSLTDTDAGIIGLEAQSSQPSDCASATDNEYSNGAKITVVEGIFSSNVDENINTSKLNESTSSKSTNDKYHPFERMKQENPSQWFPFLARKASF